MADHRYRYKAILGALFVEAGEPLPEALKRLALLIRDDDGPGIVAWLEERLDADAKDLQDFRRTYRHIEARYRRLRSMLDRLEDEIWNDDDQVNALDEAAWGSRWDHDERLWQERQELRRLLDEDPELGWYWDEVGLRAERVRLGQRRIRLAKDVAGIELIPTRRRDRENP